MSDGKGPRRVAVKRHSESLPMLAGKESMSLIESRTQVLLVEDNAADIALLTKQLREVSPESCIVTSVTRNVDACNALANGQFDVVLLDLTLPDSTGLETIEQITEFTKEIPVVVLTGMFDEDLGRAAIRSGVQDYLIKGETTGQLIVRSIYYAIERKRLELALRELNRQLEEQSLTDELTQLANRRRFNQVFRTEWNRASRTESPISVLAIDIDCFKQFNDTYGHAEGDVCLRSVAEAIECSLRRAGDLVARVGGEEFMAVLPDTNAEQAFAVASLVGKNIRDLGIQHSTSVVCDTVTASIGIATIVPNLQVEQSELLETADKALYEAKQSGRDRAVAYRHEATNDAGWKHVTSSKKQQPPALHAV